MTIEKMRNNNELTVSLEGRLDTVTAPSLEAELKANLDGIQELVLIFRNWNIFPQQDFVSFSWHKRP